MTLARTRDFWAGLIFVALGIGFARGATVYAFGTSARPGPAYLPLGLGIILAVLGGAILLRSLPKRNDDEAAVGPIAWRPLLVIAAAIVMFGAGLPFVGLAISLPALVFVVSLAGDEFRLREVLANCVAITVACWLLFIKGLGLTIPVWPSSWM